MAGFLFYFLSFYLREISISFSFIAHMDNALATMTDKILCLQILCLNSEPSRMALLLILEKRI